jgi:hypothetical protein
MQQGRGKLVRKQGAQYNVSENLTVGLWISASLTLSSSTKHARHHRRQRRQWNETIQKGPKQEIHDSKRREQALVEEGSQRKLKERTRVSQGGACFQETMKFPCATWSPPAEIHVDRWRMVCGQRTVISYVRSGWLRMAHVVWCRAELVPSFPLKGRALVQLRRQNYAVITERVDGTVVRRIRRLR